MRVRAYDKLCYTPRAFQEQAKLAWRLAVRGRSAREIGQRVQLSAAVCEIICKEARCLLRRFSKMRVVEEGARYDSRGYLFLDNDGLHSVLTRIDEDHISLSLGSRHSCGRLVGIGYVLGKPVIIHYSCFFIRTGGRVAELHAIRAIGQACMQLDWPAIVVLARL